MPPCSAVCDGCLVVYSMKLPKHTPQIIYICSILLIVSTCNTYKLGVVQIDPPLIWSFLPTAIDWRVGWIGRVEMRIKEWLSLDDGCVFFRDAITKWSLLRHRFWRRLSWDNRSMLPGWMAALIYSICIDISYWRWWVHRVGWIWLCNGTFLLSMSSVLSIS